MEKLAVFVEGQTEEVFIAALIRQIATERDVHIDTVCAYGGGAAGDRVFNEVLATQKPEPHKRYYVLISNSAGYSKVLADIRDNYDSLCSQGYKMIIGLRDVKPQAHGDIDVIRQNFVLLTKRAPLTPLLVLATMETEAWFIGETTHFLRLDRRLTPAVVERYLGYDPKNVDLETVADPADDLHCVYTAVGRGYNKSRRHAERTVRVLDYEAIYLELGARFADLANLIVYLNGFFV